MDWRLKPAAFGLAAFVFTFAWPMARRGWFPPQAGVLVLFAGHLGLWIAALVALGRRPFPTYVIASAIYWAVFLGLCWAGMFAVSGWMMSD